MKIRKAVITAAARSQRRLPLQSLVDRDGIRKSVLQILVEEARAAGADDVCVVVCPGDEEVYRGALSESADPVRFVAQQEPRGYGHALLQAREFVGDEPFLHQVGDHLFLSADRVRCTERLVAAACDEECAVSGVQPTREHLLPYFGTIGGRRIAGTHDRYLIERVAEKPTPTEAEQSLLVPGLRAGHYLCFVGAHILPPLVLERLERTAAEGGENIQLSPVLDDLASREKYLALETPGRRYPMDTRYGLLMAQLALALSGPDRDEVLAGLCDLLAQREAAR